MNLKNLRLRAGENTLSRQVQSILRHEPAIPKWFALPSGWSIVRQGVIIRNPFVGVPVMRFSILIPAMAVLGLAGCQVPAPTTAGAPFRTAATEAAPAATPAPVQTHAPPAAPAVAETEVEAVPVEEAEPADAAPTADRANASTEQAETAASEQADELAVEDEPADSQMADTIVESRMGGHEPTRSFRGAGSGRCGGLRGRGRPIGTENRGRDGEEVPLTEDNDGEVEIALASPPPPPLRRCRRSSSGNACRA